MMELGSWKSRGHELSSTQIVVKYVGLGICEY